MSFRIETDENINLRACRICVNSKYINFVILNHQNGWLQLFEYCFGLELSSQDEPRLICKQCADNVESYADFKKQCLKTDQFWKSLKRESTLKTGENDFHKNDCSIDNFEIEAPVTVYNNDKEIISNNDYMNTDSCMVNNITNNLNKESSEPVWLPSKENVLLQNNKECSSYSSRNKTKHCEPSVNSKVKEFTCNKCQRNYASQLWYQRHLKLCNSNKQDQKSTFIHQEDDGGKGANSKDLLPKLTENNYKCNIQDNFLHFCGICSFSSNTTVEVNKHLDKHWTNNDLQCTQCDFVGKDQAAVAAHRYTHYEMKSSSFICHICQAKTKSQLTLQFHYRKVHLHKIGGLCSQAHCDKVYNSWKLWKSHEKLHNHPGFICDICGQKYRHRHLIIEHLINHMNPPSHLCDICGRKFLRLRNLRDHIENLHTQPDPIKCSHCNRMFKNQHYLRAHERRLAMDKVWKCTICPMEYPMLSSLNSHMRSHSDEKPHCCHICGSRFKAKGQLGVHIRNHSGDRPFKCALCPKAFTSRVQLKTHSIIHTGILPYKCLHCEKAFRKKKLMLKHCSNTHKELENKIIDTH